MALHTKKIYYQRNGVTSSVNLYTNQTDVGSDYIGFSNGGETLYAKIDAVGSANESFLRVKKNGAIKSILSVAETPPALKTSVLAAGSDFALGRKLDGTAMAVGQNSYGQLNVSTWTNIAQVFTGYYASFGLKTGGTVEQAGMTTIFDTTSWTDIVFICGGNNHALGVKSNKTVVAAGANTDGRCDVSTWTDIIQVAAGLNHSLGLKANGTVVATGNNAYNQCDVSTWTDVVYIAATYYGSFGVKANGTIVTAGNINYLADLSGVASWTDIVAIAPAVGRYVLGLKSNATVVATGNNTYGQCNVSSWNNIVHVTIGGGYTSIGLKADGTIITVGSDGYSMNSTLATWDLIA